MHWIAALITVLGLAAIGECLLATLRPLDGRQEDR